MELKQEQDDCGEPEERPAIAVSKELKVFDS